jgi:hypothetical protein
MGVDEIDTEIAHMEALLRRAKKGIVDALATDVERATSPLWRAHLQSELEQARAMWPELDVA